MGGRMDEQINEDLFGGSSRGMQLLAYSWLKKDPPPSGKVVVFECLASGCRWSSEGGWGHRPSQPHSRFNSGSLGWQTRQPISVNEWTNTLTLWTGSQPSARAVLGLRPFPGGPKLFPQIASFVLLSALPMKACHPPPAPSSLPTLLSAGLHLSGRNLLQLIGFSTYFAYSHSFFKPWTSDFKSTEQRELPDWQRMQTHLTERKPQEIVL